MGKKRVPSLRKLKAILPSVLAWWEACKSPGVIIGGLAVSLLGRPRTTRDVDGLVLLSDSRFESFLDRSKEFGFVPRLPDALEFAKASRSLLLTHKPSSIQVDISLGGLPYEQMVIENAIQQTWGELVVPLPRPEDLIVLKAVAHRPNDLHDIAGILDSHPGIDEQYIRQWVDEFATILETPEIFIDLDKLLQARKTR